MCEINLDGRKHQSKVEANAGEQSKGVTRSGENLSDLALKSLPSKTSNDVFYYLHQALSLITMF